MREVAFAMLLPAALGCQHVQVVVDNNDPNPSGKAMLTLPCTQAEEDQPIWSLQNAKGEFCAVDVTFNGCPGCVATLKYRFDGGAAVALPDQSVGAQVKKTASPADEVFLSCVGKGDGCQYSINTVTCREGVHDPAIQPARAKIDTSVQKLACGGTSPSDAITWTIPDPGEHADGCDVTLLLADPMPDPRCQARVDYTPVSYGQSPFVFKADGKDGKAEGPRTVTFRGVKDLKASCGPKCDPSSSCHVSLRRAECPGTVYK